jgi:hypothetical protein
MFPEYVLDSFNITELRLWGTELWAGGGRVFELLVCGWWGVDVVVIRDGRRVSG